MPDGSSLRGTLRAAHRQHWADSGTWLGYSLVGGLFPVWAHALILPLVSQGHRWLDVIRRGELLLYSAAFLAPSIYVVVRFADAPFIHRPIFVLVSVMGLLCSTALFAGITAFGSGFGVVPPLNQDLILLLSVPLFGVAVVLAFFVNLFDNVRTNPDVRSAVAAERRRLEERFDQLEEGDDATR